VNREDLILPQDDASWTLAELAAEFTGELRATGSPTGDLRTAGLLLRLVTESMPGPVRSSFLFLCWQEWSRGVSAPVRVELARRADAEAAQILRTCDPAALDPAVRRVWTGYADRLRVFVAEHRDAGRPLLNYWLFEHAGRTRQLLEVPALCAASAGRSLRAASGAGPECPAPVVFALPAGAPV
jgi:hypothetical protein